MKEAIIDILQKGGSTLREFEKEYMTLDSYINLSRVFEYERDGETPV